MNSQTLKTTEGRCRKANKCNTELVARVKAMVDTDIGVSLQEIADYLGINLSSGPRVLKEKLGYKEQECVC